MQAAPVYQPEQSLQNEQQVTAGSTQEPVNSLLQSGDITEAQTHATPQTLVAEPPPVSALTAPVAPLPTAQIQAPVSAPTPPAVRESSRPSSMPPAGIIPPERPNAHGSPTRVYLNQNVTPYLLEGMKYLAAYEPEKPLEWLSGFLAQRSAEVEGKL